jgi:peptide/nickel transport system substrate-binding protein
MVMNARIAPFDDVRARQAVTLGVDRDALLAVIQPGETGGAPETLFADGSPFNGDTTLPAYDHDAAQELFDELAADGKPVAFTITSYPTTVGRQTTEAIQAQLNQYDNVEVQVEVLDFPGAIAKTVQQTFQMINGGLQLGAAPALTLYQQLYGTSRSNLAGVADPDLDAALEAGLVATDEDAQVEAFSEVARLYGELAPSLLYTRYKLSLAYNDRLHGLELYGTTAVRTDTMWVSD